MNGMGLFWKDVSRSMFKSLYSCVIPSVDSVVSALDVNETQQIDKKITTWLHRFVSLLLLIRSFSFCVICNWIV